MGAIVCSTDVEAPVGIRLGVPILGHVRDVNLCTGDRLALRITNDAPYVYESVASRKNQRQG